MTAPRSRAAPPRYDPAIAAFLADIYSSCNAPSRLNRDPLAIVKRYAKPDDRELAAFVCSTLAFGSVDLIMRACEAALAPLGESPASALDAMDDADIRAAWAGFQYRFCFPSDMACLMRGLARARREVGSLEDLFLRGDRGGEDIVGALGAFVREIKRLGSRRGQALRENLLPDPERGSACKRLFLCLRWLVRSDSVDPGGWQRVDRSRLVVPLDLHMTRVCHERLGFLAAPRADLRGALAATAAFRLYAPEDPVKYDFALTRPGIDPAPGDERFACS
jgi:TIGR02757 family protein